MNYVLIKKSLTVNPDIPFAQKHDNHRAIKTSTCCQTHSQKLTKLYSKIHLLLCIQCSIYLYPQKYNFQYIQTAGIS